MKINTIIVAVMLLSCGAEKLFDEPALQFNGSIVALGQAPAFGVGTDGLTATLFTMPDDNKDGCKPITGTPKGKWIALISRGRCHFANKVRNAQIANGSAVVIYDDEEHQEVVPIMCAVQGDDSDITIPSIAVSHSEGPELAKLKGKELKLTAFRPFPNARCNPYFPFKWTALTICVISGAMLALCVGALLAAVRRRNSTVGRNFFEPIEAILGRAPVQTTMTADAVESLPSKIYAPLEEGTAEATAGWQSNGAADSPGDCSNFPVVSREENLCSICLEEFQAGQRQRLLPCSHVFHADCVDEWLTTRRAVCPICKQDPTSSATHASSESGAPNAQELCEYTERAANDSTTIVINPTAIVGPATAAAPAPTTNSHRNSSSALEENTMDAPLLDGTSAEEMA